MGLADEDIKAIAIGWRANMEAVQVSCNRPLECSALQCGASDAW
jgi:hypothetical protein